MTVESVMIITSQLPTSLDFAFSYALGKVMTVVPSTEAESIITQTNKR